MKTYSYYDKKKQKPKFKDFMCNVFDNQAFCSSYFSRHSKIWNYWLTLALKQLVDKSINISIQKLILNNNDYPVIV